MLEASEKKLKIYFGEEMARKTNMTIHQLEHKFNTEVDRRL